jgi:hypothetical protein
MIYIYKPNNSTFSYIDFYTLFTVAFLVERKCYLNKMAYNIQRKPRVRMSALLSINM